MYGKQPFDKVSTPKEARFCQEGYPDEHYRDLAQSLLKLRTD